MKNDKVSLPQAFVHDYTTKEDMIRFQGKKNSDRAYAAAQAKYTTLTWFLGLFVAIGALLIGEPKIHWGNSIILGMFFVFSSRKYSEKEMSKGQKIVTSVTFVYWLLILLSIYIAISTY